MTLDKPEWRSRVHAGRKTVSAQIRLAEALALVDVVSAWAEGLAGRTVAGYVPVGNEPGSLAMLDSLRDAWVRVILPVLPNNSAAPGPLDWAVYEGQESLRPAAFGLREPAGPRLGPRAIAEAVIVLVPALAVDRRGVRLGRGAGYYDRTLGLTRPGAQLIAVVRDVEVVDQLPVEPHDIRMTAALTPRRGVIPLP